jgi:hypothetical protein
VNPTLSLHELTGHETLEFSMNVVLSKDASAEWIWEGIPWFPEMASHT